MKNKKFLAFLLVVFSAFFVAAAALTACGSDADTGNGQNETHVHTYGDWLVTKIPTDTETGTASRSCTDCDDTQEITLPALSDTNYTISDITATETEDGTAKYSIIIGGQSYTFTVDFQATGVQQEHTHTYGDWIITAPNETQTGTASRTCINGDDTQTITLPALLGGGYTITNNTATATEAGTATYTITIGGNEISFTAATAAIGEDHTHNIILINAKAATCTEAGNTAYYYCSECGKCFSDSNGENQLPENSWVIPSTGHDYDTVNIVWTWDEYSSATAKFICKNDGEHFETKTAEITSEVTKAASCTEAGIKTYTATVIFDGKQYTATKTEELAANGHDYDVINIIWNWSGYTSVAATFTCKNDSTHTETKTATITSEITKTATCTEAGIKTYTATVTLDGKQYSATKTEELAAIGHDYDAINIIWNWSGYTSAAATFTCKNDSTHTETKTATITSEVTKAATCTDNGIKTYTATVTLNGKQYSATKTEELSSIGHDYDVINIIWNWSGYTSAAATFTCKNDSTHTETKTATITSDITKAATCTADGVKTYAAAVTFEGKEYTSSLTETIYADGHTYGLWTVTTIPTDTTKGLASRVCTRCGDTQTLELPILSDSGYTLTGNTATQTEAGTGIYTITLNGVEISFSAATSAIGEDHKHTIVFVGAKAASCTQSGNTAYYYCSECGKCFSDSEGENETTENSWIIAATGHDYDVVNIAWVWNGYTSAAATFTCKNDGTHTETKAATITSSLIAAATCTTAGTITHTATVTFDGVQYTDIKTETLSAIGHDYDVTNIAWTWSGYTSATAALTCKNDSTHKETKAATITYAITTAATCTAAGVKTYAATVIFEGVQYTNTKTEAISATGHDYDTINIIWNWSGYTLATATFTCKNDGSHTETKTATITSAITTAATCTAAGVKTYTATVTFEGKEYTNAKTEAISAIGHDYDVINIIWNWNGYSSAAATFTCKNDSTHTETKTATITSAIATAATCTTAGVKTYTATVTFEGKQYTNTKTETIPAIGHNYDTNNIIWNWTDYSSATATFTCKNDSAHTVTKTATITIAITTAATCTVSGIRTYTATVTFEGKDYTATKTETISAIGHNYDAENIVWNWNGYSSATATVTCKNDSSHTETITAVITSVITTEAICTASGIKTYTATVTLNGKEYTTTKNETISAAGHTAEEAVKEDETAATCMQDGYYISVVYCSVCNEKISSETIIIPATGHTLVQVEGKAATCTENGWSAYEYCTVCNYTTYSEIHATGHTAGTAVKEDETAATCTQDGHYNSVVYCSVCSEKLNSETITVSATGHSLVQVEAKAATCTEAGWNAYEYCTVCSYTTYSDIPATGHTAGTAVKEDETAATCTQDGHYNSVVYCSVCSEKLNSETVTILAAGHSYGDWTVTAIPAIAQTGTASRYCSCGDCQTLDLPALSDSGYTITNNTATATAAGTATYTITVSGIEFSFIAATEATGATYTILYTATKGDLENQFVSSYTGDKSEETSSIIVDYSDLDFPRTEKQKSTENGEVTFDYAWKIEQGKAVSIKVPKGAADVVITIYVSHIKKDYTKTVYISTAENETSDCYLEISGTSTSSPQYLYTLTATLTEGQTYYIWAEEEIDLYAFSITYTL